jgi:cellulose synthase/poly-beta-1,6-N-acetylglucosamine synthase-like glycosyltransferase
MTEAWQLLRAFGPGELYLMFWLAIVMDVPRYLLAALAVALAPGRYPQGETRFSLSAVVSCFNEEGSIAGCVASLQAAGADQIIVVNDGSTDATLEVVSQTSVTVIDNPERLGKPGSVNLALMQCTGDLVVIADADTRLDADALILAKPYFLDSKVAAVGLNLRLSNAEVSLTTRLQAIEYAVAFTAGRMLSDALGILPIVSGAAGVFRRQALLAVGGEDIEVAEDAALAMKLRQARWKLRYAGNAGASTAGPEEPATLILQRLRWDASIITIWWRKFGCLVNPFSRDLEPLNLITSLDVLVFSVLMPLIFPVYLEWLWLKVGPMMLTILGAVLFGLALVEIVIVLLVGLPPRLLFYLPLFLLVQTFLMRPLRVIALLAELAFSITKYDEYLPASQRGRLT